MTLFKHSLTAAADRLGLALIPKWRLDRLPFTEHLSKLLRQYEIDLVIDVGANVGQYRDFLRNEVGYEGWIASFEPDPDTWQILEERARNDPRWRTYHTALGAQAGTATLNVTGHSTLNSLLKPDFDSTDFAALKREVVREVTVPVSTLDHDLPQLLEEFKANNAYLKLDTQGFDLEVLRGAEHSLKNIAALQFEGSVVPLYEGMPSYSDMLEHLMPQGFSISNMFAICHDTALRMLEFDCVMVRADPNTA